MLYIVALVIISLALLLFLSKYLFAISNHPNIPKPQAPASNFAIIIPARDESAVIEDLCKSLQNQTIKISPENVFIVVESASDPTTAIAKKYHYRIIVRPHPEKQRKGYALDEAVHAILKHKKFDLYFIFDADNTISPDFIEKMLETYQKGYDIGIGYRKVKNPNSAIAIGPGLIFTIINTLLNHTYTKHGLNCIASGTGYFLSGRIINHLGGFPFHTMTEDYEISLYSAIHHYSTFYNTKAIFYDTQPHTYSQYFIQRTRWEKGYFEARHLFRSQLFKNLPKTYILLIGIYDIVLFIIGLILLLITLTISYGPLPLFLTIAAVYIALLLLTALLLHLERYRLRAGLYFRTILLHPLLLLTYIPCLFVVILKRDLSWHRIEH